MRFGITLCVLALQATAPAPADQKWKHEKLLERVGMPMPTGQGIKDIIRFNERGDVMYNVDFTPYRNRVNLAKQVGLSSGLAEGINERGQVAWRGAGSVYVDERYYDGIDGVPIIYGISGAGEPFWLADYAQTLHKPDDLFVGHRKLDLDRLLGSSRHVFAKHVNEAGDVAWSSDGPLLGGWQHAFKNETDLTTLVLGKEAYGDANWINSSGQLLWTGYAPATGISRLYLDGVELPFSDVGTGDQMGPTGRVVNDRGDVLWEGIGPRTDYYRDVFLNGTNLSAEFYKGTGWHQASAYYLSESGHVQWFGYGNVGGLVSVGDVYVDSVNLSGPILGYGPGRRYLQGYGVDESGHALWSGYGAGNGFLDRVYVDNFDLSSDALGDEYVPAYCLRMGSSGHALWGTWHETTNSWDIWLSTPVPEPAAGWLLLALPFIRGRGRSRDRTSAPSPEERGLPGRR